MKRVFDFAAAFIGLLLLSPLIIVIGLLIKLDDRGPVFFRQRRVGKDEKLFVLYKFRSMRIIESAEEGDFDPGNSSRITSLGKFLRRTKIDELPQLINVLTGDLSLVGPRPEVEQWVALYPERWKKILSVKPGMTDNASILYRDEEEILSKSVNPVETYRNVILPRKLEIYLDYVNNHSFLGDIVIILRTLKTILFK